MAARKTILSVGAIGAAAGAYYLYEAGGDPSVAGKDIEHDAARVSSKVKGELPGSGKEAKTEAKRLGERAGSSLDGAMNDAKATANKVDAKLEGYRAESEKKLESTKKELGTNLNSAVDKFDKTVEKQAAQSKSWMSSIFGGK